MSSKSSAFDLVYTCSYGRKFLIDNTQWFFFAQIRVLGMLDHPNIISYYDSFEEDGTLMIEMEYADGGWVI